MPKNKQYADKSSENNNEQQNKKAARQDIVLESERAAYLRRWRGWERLWAVLLTVSLLLLLFYQGWLYFEQNRLLPWPDLHISGENWYGTDYAEVAPVVQHSDGLWGSVTLELQDYSELRRAVVLLNGVEAASFASNTLTLRVFDGDLLEIDCTAYARPVRFRLLKTSAGIDRSALQAEMELCGERANVGQIIFK